MRLVTQGEESQNIRLFDGDIVVVDKSAFEMSKQLDRQRLERIASTKRIWPAAAELLGEPVKFCFAKEVRAG